MTSDAPAPALKIRQASIEDLDDVADVCYESASAMDGAPVEMPSRQELRRRIDVELAAGWDLHVAAHDARLVGMLALKPRTAVLDQLFVRPESRGRGLGRALLDFAKNVMPEGFTGGSLERARTPLLRA